MQISSMASWNNRSPFDTSPPNAFFLHFLAKASCIINVSYGCAFPAILPVDAT